MTKQAFTLYCTMLMAIGGCTSTFSVSEYTPGEPANGIVYALPRTVVTVSIPYRVNASSRFQLDRYVKTVSAELGEVKVLTSVEPDPKNYFQIETSMSDAATSKNTFSASINENLTLAKSSVITENAAGGFFRDALSLLVSVNSSLERSDSGVDPRAIGNELASLLAIQESINEAMLVLFETTLSREPTSEEVDLAETRHAFYENALAYTKARIGELRVRKPFELNVVILCTIEFGNEVRLFEINEGSCPRMKEAYEKIEMLSPEMSSDLIRSFTFELSGNPKEPIKAKIASGQNNAYIYRIPYIGRYTVYAKAAADPTVVASGPISIAQLGSYGRLHVQDTQFAKYSSELELHASTGGLKMFRSVREVDAGSGAASQLSGMVDAVRQATSEPTDLEILETENSSLEAQIRNIEFQRQLAELLAEEQID